LNSVTSLAKLTVCAATGNTMLMPSAAVVCADATFASSKPSASQTIEGRMRTLSGVGRGILAPGPLQILKTV